MTVVIILLLIAVSIPAALGVVILLNMAFNKWAIMTPTGYKAWRQHPDWPFV